MFAGRMDVARRARAAAIAADTKQSGQRFLLGFCLYLDNDFQGARDALARADQNDARVILYIALSEEGMNHSDAATLYYERSLKLDPVNAQARVAYSRLLRRQRHLDATERLVDV